MSEHQNQNSAAAGGQNELLVMRDSVAKEVFLALEEDGYYGQYTLGEELWEKFRAAYIDA